MGPWSYETCPYSRLLDLCCSRVSMRRVRVRRQLGARLTEPWLQLRC